MELLERDKEWSLIYHDPTRNTHFIVDDPLRIHQLSFQETNLPHQTLYQLATIEQSQDTLSMGDSFTTMYDQHILNPPPLQ